ncbi:MAG: cupredoxin domain-containing protein [Thermomicrobiales bacterium]
MSVVRPSIRLRAFAVIVGFALALAASYAIWMSVSAADATPPASSGCAKASETKGAPAGTPEAGASCIENSMHDIYFGANLLTIPANTDVKVIFDNAGAAEHTFVLSDHNNKDVKNLDIKLSVQPGKSGEVTINAPAGTYYFWCDIPGHEPAGMWGILKVTDNGPITAQSVDNPKEA